MYCNNHKICYSQTSLSNLVLVDSTCQNLRRLAMAVASQKPILLEGPIGCGKTALVEYLAAVTGHVKAPDILKVQLGDQTDSKVRFSCFLFLVFFSLCSFCCLWFYNICSLSAVKQTFFMPLFSVDVAGYVPLHRYSWKVCVAARVPDPGSL